MVKALVKKIANQLDFGDFRQLILYFGVSGISNIELKLARWHIPFFLFILTICISFLIRKLSTFYRTFVSKFVKNYTIVQVFCSTSRTLVIYNTTFDYFVLTSLAHFIGSVGTLASYTYTKLTYLACLVCCNNFRTW